LKKTLVLGASPNPMRFSYKMVRSLIRHHTGVIPVGFRPGEIDGVSIEIGKPLHSGVHTILLYLGPDRQQAFYDYIFELAPRRLIFNPGTYNPELAVLAREQGIEVIIDCSLVMLSKGIY